MEVAERLVEQRSSPITSSKKYEGSPSRLIFASICTFIAPFSFGLVIGYSSPAIPQMLQESALRNNEHAAWFGSFMTLGAIFGGPLAGLCIEKLGRRTTLSLSSLPMILGWWLITYGGESSLGGRFVCGFASGMVTVAAPVYIAEISTKSMRGFLGSGIQLSITLGIVSAYVGGMFLQWDSLAYFGLFPALLTACSMCLVPETPRWLLLKNRKGEAMQALASLRGPHTDIEEECRDIEEGLDIQETFSWAEFKKPELSRPLKISVIIMIFQQFSGINAVMFYTVSIFKSANLENSELATVYVGAVQVAATFMACLMMDRAGRRKLLIVGGIIMCLTCFTFGLYYHKVASGTPATSLSWLAIGSVIVYIIGFSLGWGPIPMLIMSEIFPARARGLASGIAIFSNWFCAFIVTKEFLFLQDLLGNSGVFWLFSLSCLASVAYVWRYVPETKGKSLEDIELYFLGKSILY